MRTRNRWWRQAAFAVTAAVTAAGAGLALSQPAQARPAGGTSSPVSGIAQGSPPVTAKAWAAGRAAYGKQVTRSQAIVAYWTPARMRSARPAQESADHAKALRQAADAARTGTASLQASGARHSAPPAPGLLSARRLASGARAAAVDPGLDPYNQTAMTMGKVFFTMNGQNKSCSGTVIYTAGGNLVWTAGHCVYKGQWAGNWVFVPAYDDDLPNPAPHGWWTARGLWAMSGWTDDSDYAEDMGAAIMDMNFGSHIAHYLGGQGFTTGQGRNVAVRTFGYPGEGSFDGGNLISCSGTTWPVMTLKFFFSERLRISCDYTRGASGGAWLWGYDGTFGYVNGNNSTLNRIVNPTTWDSPYYDDTAWTLFQAVRDL